MINRQNWLDVQHYLHHFEKTLGRDRLTIIKIRGFLRHLLEWADAIPLGHAYRIDQVLPVYLLTARNDGRTTPLSYETVYKNLATVRRFYAYAIMMWASRYKLPPGWVETLTPRSKPQPSLDDHRFYTLDEIKAIAAVAVETLREERGQAGACMMFLSGIRPDALASIPLQCVDLPNRRLFQIPSMGIRTKNDKAAITYLLDIPEVFERLQSWDRRVRQMTPTSLWYANLSQDGLRMVETPSAFEGRALTVAKDIRLICDRAGVKYKSPHKFRHGHIVHARSLARTMEEAKAVSQNVMHSDIVITDKVYSTLQTSKVQSTILNLGTQNKNEQTELIRLLDQLRQHLNQ